MSYITRSINNIPWNNYFLGTNKTDVWILSIDRKESTTVQNVLEAILSQKLTVKWKGIQVITSRIYQDILITNIKSNRCIFNQIRHTQDIRNKLVSITKNLQHHIILEIQSKALSDLNNMTQCFQTIRKWQYPKYSVHHFYLPCYHQTKRYS